MRSFFRRFFAVLLCFMMLLSLLPQAAAEEDTAVAADITAQTDAVVTGFDSPKGLFDKNIKTYYKSAAEASVTLTNEDGIGSLYLMFNLEYGEYTITDDDSGKAVTAGTYGFLHEYVDLYAALGTCPTSITIAFTNGAVRLSEIYVFSSGAAPEFVQTWNVPLEGGADLVLFATHSDDDQLFFAGLLPYYAAERGLRVQVVYLTDHRNLTNARTHEMLNGLWAVGVTAYPVFGTFADFRIDDLAGTYKEYERLGTTRDEMLQFVVEQVRRFKPLVAVGHDPKGEYGHGMHMAYSELLREAVEVSSDETVYPESAAAYGTWDTPKTYLHLYEENPIVMDFDQPLESFDGLTAFQVSQKLGYPCHETQQWTWFTDWINGYNNEITKATEIKTYNPCYYGLYRTTVGLDTGANDMFENVTDYAEQERIEEEKRLEEERKKQEEEARKEQERLEEEKRQQEEAARLEAERLAQEKAEAEAKERAAQLRNAAIALAACLVIAVVLIIILRKRLHHAKR